MSKTRSRDIIFKFCIRSGRRSPIPSQCSPPSSIASCHLSLSHQETKCIPSQFVSHNIWVGARLSFQSASSRQVWRRWSPSLDSFFIVVKQKWLNWSPSEDMGQKVFKFVALTRTAADKRQIGRFRSNNLLRVLLYNGRTDNMWGACGDKIKVLPTSCQCLTHILPSPTKYLHFACGVTIEAIWGWCWENVDCSKLSVNNMCLEFWIGIMLVRCWNYLT